jgi:excisionase family DNA binding protein
VKQPLGFQPDEAEAMAAVYARVPVEAAQKLDRAASVLRISKREIVASLLSALDTGEEGPLVRGRAEARPAADAADAEVLALDQLAALLRVDVSTMLELAERGELPGRQLGGEWRFSRTAVISWLGGS